MKYSFMTFSCPELTLTEVLSLARRFGYDGIEPRLVSGHKHGIETDTPASGRGEIRQQAEDSGIALCCIATSCTYANPAETKQKVEETQQCIDLAADVGAPRLRVFGGGIAEGVSREDAVKLVAESLQSVADYAGQRGVTVCMETHDDWCDPTHVAEVMRRADHPAIAVNWDIMHPIVRGNSTMDQAFETLKPWIKHVHFHDGAHWNGNLELVPIGQGEIDHRRAVELLRSISWDGYLSGEWIGWEPYEIHLPRELATMKGYER